MAQTHGWQEYLLLFFLGNIIGSFLNVVIYRVPAGLSIVKPGSHCPQCKRPVKPWENIPIISYIILGGRCAGCHGNISMRYPAVEALTGCLFMVLLFYFGWNQELLIYAVLAALLLALSAIDLATWRLPNSIVLTGSILAVLLTLALRREFLVQMLLGALTGLGLLTFMSMVGRLLFRKETLGMGDIKLAGMIGLFLGPRKTAGMFILGVFLGALFGGGMILIGKHRLGKKIPFGPYLAGGALAALLWGRELWRWYMHLVLP